MSSPDQHPTSRVPAADKKDVEALVAACIEALERGDSEPSSRICADRPDLLPRVQKRLAQLAQRGLIPGTDPLLPAAIGPYRVVKVLGSGGMGTVYLAEQREPVRRLVALKVVKLGMDTREVVARFQAERQALALMNHPNIAQVFEAGITEEGRPYFAMEYVQGHSLTSICDMKSLTAELRVRLFTTVCRAVQHAHDRGFIHRDLKPSNILVVEHEGNLVPKVIDFGIAKATAQAVADAATMAEDLRTRADQILGTPEYMSPEQAISGGVDVDTRTDVYSLGVTLYELLCGELPFDSTRLRRGSRGEMERILLDELPTLPSKRLSQVDGVIVAARGGERSTVQRAVSGELDWITLRALAKQREHRYPSALALAEDLERWLQNVPVLAAPPGRSYRLRKFVRRHRVAVGATFAVLVSLVAGLVVSLQATWRAQRAQARESAALDNMRSFYGLARDAVGNLVGVADEQLAEVPQADAVRRQLLADAIGFYESLRQREPDALDLRIDMASAREHIGNLQQRLGQTTDAVATLQQAAAEVDQLWHTAPTEERLERLAIDTQAALAAAYQGAGKYAEAKRTSLQGLTTIAAVRQRGTAAGANLDSTEAGLLANLAIESDDDLKVATSYFEQALAAHARVQHATAKERSAQARCVGLYAETLTKQNQLEAAAKVLTAALAGVPDVDAKANVSLRADQAQLQDQFATVLRRLSRGEQARIAQQRAVDLYHALAEEHPDLPAYGDGEAAGLHFLAQLAQDEARLPEAIELMTRAVAIRDRLAAGQPQNYRLRMRSVRSLMSKANIEIDAWQKQGGSKDVAAKTLAAAAQRIDELNTEHGDDIDVVVTFAAVHQSIAALHSAAGEHADAIRGYESVRDTLLAKLPQWETNADLHYELAMVDNNLLQTHYLEQDPAAAAQDGERAMQHLERGLQLDARHHGLLDLAPTLVARTSTAYFAAGDREAGITTLLNLLEKPAWGADAHETAALILAEFVGPQGRDPDAELVPRVQKELRTAIDARGTIEQALARTPQRGGISHVESRLRDLDLRLALADLDDPTADRAEQERLLDEALRLADSMADLEANRLRNLFSRRAEVALEQDRVAAAVASVEQLMKRIGADGGGCYLAAVLLSQASARIDDAAEKERVAAHAVEWLHLSLQRKEVAADAARHPNFTPLRERADYKALFAK